MLSLQVGSEEETHEGLDILFKLNTRKILTPVELFLEKGHGGDSIPRRVEEALDLFALDSGSLEVQEAGDDLQVVLDAVVQLPEEEFLFAKS